MHIRQALCVRTCLLLASIALLRAQTFRGSITGTTLDASGAAIPGSVVRAQNAATGLARETLSSTAGDFNFPDLPLGMYTVTVLKDGFQSTSVKYVEVAVSRVTSIAVKLAGIVGPRTVQDLPVNGRDFRQMLKLNPGVSPSSSPVNGMKTSGKQLSD